ncbi:hypothetical protein [Nocardia wallacei]|uniref:hypothetical protein n=1 Tax=Nocardia wallacei TaxID=480035 RepID=UPI002454C0B4|nr:hypothetical protein [Nocardia wallacei]
MTEQPHPAHTPPPTTPRPRSTATVQIHVVDGEDGERLARQQASALLEITQWQAHQQASTTDDPPSTDP